MDIRKAVREADDLPTETVEVPEWGVTLLLRGLSAGAFNELWERVSRRNAAGEREVNTKVWNVELVIACALDPETGEAAFDPADREMLLGKAAGPVNRIAGIAGGLNGSSESLDEAPVDSSSG